MERTKLVALLALLMTFACTKVEKAETTPETEEPTKSMVMLKQELADKGFQTFDYVDEQTKDTILMQQ